ncbi:DUF2169 domain-containing protein [Ideonella azotifigens]|uniref:DUF2169 domain-containing protein n=1 Tax=Ideonella azotifigens TaxID=513160 RepID=A0ABP3VBX8_9BURK|nr:DUF2169 domain-containing protein [Ideonella azotifigens]MCD2344354.1 DUF2169 domain-containing protein [Ideonella azotifigens]
MWQILNATPFSAAQSWIRGLDGAETWLVVVKATYDVFSDGTTAPASVQPPPVRTPEYWEDAPGVLRYENDFVLAKITTDIVINGTAHSPGGQPVGSLDVGFRVGGVGKRLRVSGDRQWGSSGSWRPAPQPFVLMPMRYSRAFGGADSASSRPDKDWYWPNPVGTGFATSRANAVGRALPNVEYPHAMVEAWSDRPTPAGFGFIGSHWQARAHFAGTYDEAWERDRQPLLPRDFDPRHWQSAPSDQWSPEFLRGGEEVALLNLTREGVTRFVLPSTRLALRTRFMNGDRIDHPPPSLHTVIIEPDAARVSLVWHSALECHSRVYQLDHTRVDMRDAQLTHQEEDLEALLGP